MSRGRYGTDAWGLRFEERFHSEEEDEPTLDQPSSIGAVHIDPFAGKCIHGVSGALLLNGYLNSADCMVCNPDLIDYEDGAFDGPDDREAKYFRQFG